VPEDDSPFLAVPSSEWLAANDSAFAIADRHPASPGHALVLPRRVIATWWEATDPERNGMLGGQLSDQPVLRMRPEQRHLAWISLTQLMAPLHPSLPEAARLQGRQECSPQQARECPGK
jgi:hypothetical protein